MYNAKNIHVGGVNILCCTAYVWSLRDNVNVSPVQDEGKVYLLDICGVRIYYVIRVHYIAVVYNKLYFYYVLHVSCNT